MLLFLVGRVLLFEYAIYNCTSIAFDTEVIIRRLIQCCLPPIGEYAVTYRIYQFVACYMTFIDTEQRYLLLFETFERCRRIYTNEYPVISYHFHIGYTHIFAQQADIGNCMIFPLAASSQYCYFFSPLRYTEIDSLSKVVCFLFGYSIYDTSKSYLIFGRKRVAIADYGMRCDVTFCQIIDCPVATYQIVAIIQNR